MTNNFQLFVCTNKVHLIQEAIAGGADGVIVEWENININVVKSTTEKIQDLEKVRRCTDAWVICRLLPFNSNTKEEVRSAILNGVDEIWLPKVTSFQEVETILDIVKGECQVGIVLETIAAIEIRKQLAQLPIKRVHIGLNDLAESLNNSHSFSSLIDGTVENILQDFKFERGFGGLTLPEKGFPIPSYLMMTELIRHKCTFSLLRNSFFQDTEGKSLTLEVPRIKQALAEIAQMSPQEIAKRNQYFQQKVLELINSSSQE